MHMHEGVCAHVCRYVVTTVTLFFEGRAFNVPVVHPGQGWLAHLQVTRSSCLCPISRIRIRDAAITLNFYINTGELNSGPYGK